MCRAKILLRLIKNNIVIYCQHLKYAVPYKFCAYFRCLFIRRGKYEILNSSRYAEGFY